MRHLRPSDQFLLHSQGTCLATTGDAQLGNVSILLPKKTYSNRFLKSAQAQSNEMDRRNITVHRRPCT
jgi:hypothetical protein